MLSRYALRYGKVELNGAAEECSELFRVSISSVLRKQLVFFRWVRALATIDGNSLDLSAVRIQSCRQ